MLVLFLCLLSALKSGMILAYFIILKGDYMILAKFKYKDETESGLLNQLGERVQTLGGARI